MAEFARASEPIDTTEDPELEARWQQLVRAVIDAKADALAARQACVDAERARGSLLTASDEAVAAVAAAHAAYAAAGARVAAASAAMKTGSL